MKNIWEDSLDLIPSPSPSVKIQIRAGKLAWGVKAKHKKVKAKYSNVHHSLKVIGSNPGYLLKCSLLYWKHHIRRNSFIIAALTKKYQYSENKSVSQSDQNKKQNKSFLNFEFHATCYWFLMVILNLDLSFLNGLMSQNKLFSNSQNKIFSNSSVTEYLFINNLPRSLWMPPFSSTCSAVLSWARRQCIRSFKCNLGRP